MTTHTQRKGDGEGQRAASNLTNFKKADTNVKESSNSTESDKQAERNVIESWKSMWYALCDNQVDWHKKEDT